MIQRNLKIVSALTAETQAKQLQNCLEALGHRVATCPELQAAKILISSWHPDLIITEENLGHQADAGLELAKFCRQESVNGTGRTGIQVIVLVCGSDWCRFSRARSTGAHILLTTQDFSAVERYVQCVADQLVTDRIFGPTLTGIHMFDGADPQRNCATCSWYGCSISYGTSEVWPTLQPGRIAILNVLMSRRRGLTPREIVADAHSNSLVRALLNGHRLLPTSIKMNVTRLRRNFTSGLDNIGAPYTGSHFLPELDYGCERYRLSGNWQLVHIPLTAGAKR